MYHPLHFLQILTSITFFKNVIDVMICIECMLTNIPVLTSRRDVCMGCKSVRMLYTSLSESDRL